MKKFEELWSRVDLEPLRQLYYELKAMWLVHPQRLQRVIGEADPTASQEMSEELTLPTESTVALLDTSKLEAGSLEELVQKVSAQIQKATQAGATLVICPPEGGDLLLCLAPYEAKRVFRRIQEAYDLFWSGLSAKHRIWIAPGNRNIACYKKSFRRVAFLFGPDGSRHYQIQTHISAREREAGLVRGQEVKVWQTQAGRVAFCFPGEDRYPELGRILAAQKAEIVISQATWGSHVEVGHLAGGWARAQQAGFYFISPPEIFAPMELSIDGSGLLDTGEQEGLLTLIRLNLAKLSEVQQLKSGAKVASLYQRYLPQLYLD